MEETNTPKPATKIKKQSKPTTPRSDVNLKILAQQVVINWKKNPDITLIWTDVAQFEQVVVDFDACLFERLTIGGSKRILTKQLKVLDLTIGQHIEYLKVYLKEKYGKKAYTSYFLQFGIVKKNGLYIFPKDRDSRNPALQETLKAIVKHGFQDKTYGLQFWKDISDRYDAARIESVAITGQISDLVKTKKVLSRQIRKTMNALIHIIKGNYPENHKSVLRTWGFQKEKY